MTLEVATEGCCKGHKCDNCATCRKGRCCRRDNPDYKVPELGDWDGPIYGELGVLNDDGEKVECHCCGEWFVRLHNHVWRRHDLTAAEYRAVFGLNRGTGLVGPLFHATLYEAAKKRWLSQPIQNVPVPTSEQRSAWASQQRRKQADQHGSLIGQRREHRRGPTGLIGVREWYGRYVVYMAIDKVKTYIGTFDTPHEAARAYDAKARELYGDDARLNFP